MLARNENAVVNAPCLKNCSLQEESVNLFQGWRREGGGQLRVRSVMDSVCGVSVAPTCPITESEGWRRGQESQQLRVVLDNGGETMFKYQDCRREQGAELDHRDIRRWSYGFCEPCDFWPTWWQGCELGDGEDHACPAGEQHLLLGLLVKLFQRLGN